MADEGCFLQDARSNIQSDQTSVFNFFFASDTAFVAPSYSTILTDGGFVITSRSAMPTGHTSASPPLCHVLIVEYLNSSFTFDIYG